MCGIAGIFSLFPTPDLVRQIRRMTEAIRHRGPDDEGYLLVDDQQQVSLCGGDESDPRLNFPHIERYAGVASRLVFGFRRLSIIDLSTTGHQPMQSADGRYSIVFNGEIYNYLELRHELQAAGFTFRSQADTEVLLAGFIYWGAQVLQRLTGMFAFAIYDHQQQRLFAARDFFGIKPFYYAQHSVGFAFASEIKSLLSLEWVSRRAEPQRIYDYLRFDLNDHDGATFFADVRQLPAGHYLDLHLAQPLETIRPVRYWSLHLDAPLSISAQEAAAHLRELFLENIRLHLRSDVPVGVALSGGIDSSSITCGMRLCEPGLNLHTFSLVTDDPATSEERWIDDVIRHTRATAHKVTPAPGDVMADLEQLLVAQEEPFGSTSIYAQFRVFRLVRQHGIKVTLDGQGGDETLGGYRFFLPARMASMIRKLQWGRAAGFLNNISELSGVKGHRANYLIRSLFSAMPEWAGHQVGAFLNERGQAWLHKEWFRQRGVQFTSQIVSAPTHDRMRADLAASIQTYSLPKLLHQEDRNSMHFSVESRVPFLTPALVTFLLSLPEEYLVSQDGTSKSIFRQAMRGLVPESVLSRRDKLGFATPELIWFSQMRGWIEQTLNSETAAAIPGLSRAEMLAEWDLVQSGHKPYSKIIWRWINLIKWTEQYQVLYG